MPSQRSRLASPAEPTTSPTSPRYARIVVKAGTALLTGGDDQLDRKMMLALVEQVARLHAGGAEVILVSSGAVAAGRHELGIPRGNRDVPFRQVLAAVGQGHLMHTYEELFASKGVTVAQALLSRLDISDRLGYLNIRNTLLALLELKVVPIVNENDVVAVEELAEEHFEDNDMLSAMVANLVDADLLMLLGQVRGLYTADPHLDSTARLIETADPLDPGIAQMASGPSDGKGKGGMATKLQAAALAAASGADVAIASGREEDIVARLAAGERVGTRCPATSSKMESRKRWMMSGLSNKGEIRVDAGAVDAVVDANRSLLPAGVTDVRGSFERGDIVSVVGPDLDKIAAGIVNYCSEDVARIKGSKSGLIEAIVGHQYGAEVVHRNNMVVL